LFEGSIKRNSINDELVETLTFAQFSECPNGLSMCALPEE